MLVDTGSSADILYLSTYDKLRLPRNMLQPMTTPLTGFTGHSVYPKGIANLDLTVGLGDKKSTIKAQFTVVDEVPNHKGHRGVMWRLEKGHDMLSDLSLGKTSEKARKGGLENHPEVMTFRGVVREQNNNSPKQRECIKKPVPHEEVVKVPFADHELENTFRMGTMLEESHKEGLIQLIREYKDIFAWGPEDMLGIDTSVALHQLHLDSMYKPLNKRSDHSRTKRIGWLEQKLTCY
ncbi:hypothetical protein LIER_35244 [Lithospermum erythrorhizon]|uniref:Uncharacterized protein n=1 Tax=Lithospermum erythrorhizon TaxID=34254 RepID=A0AAV3NS09_LITER